MFKVFQVTFSRKEVDLYNAEVRDERVARVEASRDLRLFGSEDYTTDHAGLFSHVANIFVSDPEVAFHKMNSWYDEHCIDRLAPLHSLSVGDILVDDEGVALMVDPVGFTEVEFVA